MTISDVGLISGRPSASQSPADARARSTASFAAARVSGFNVTIHHSIHEINPDEWNEIVGEGRVWQSHAALALLQDGGIEDYRARYLVLRTNDGRIAAHTTAYIIETDLLIFSQGVLKRLLENIRRVLPKFLRTSIRECGCPVSAGNPMCRREGIEYTDVLALLCNALEQIAAKERIGFLLLRDFVDADVAELSELARHGFSRIPNLPTTELAVKWRSFEEYVLAMRSRHRQKIRRGLRLAQRAGLARAGPMNSPAWWMSLRDNGATSTRTRKSTVAIA